MQKAKPKALKPPRKRGQPKGVPQGTKIPMPNGGYLIAGAGGGRENGLKGGRPRSDLRARLKGTLEDRVPIIEAIADGVPIRHVEVSLLDVLPYAACPNCGEPMQAADEAKAALVTIRGKESASPSDRIKALDLAARFGLGTKDEVTLVSPDVKGRVSATVQLIDSQPTWDSKTLLDRLDRIWTD